MVDEEPGSENPGAAAGEAVDDAPPSMAERINDRNRNGRKRVYAPQLGRRKGAFGRPRTTEPS